MRRFLALFLSLCIALSGSVAMAVESSEPNRLGGYVSIFDWIQGNKDTEYPGSGGGQAAGGGAQRFTSKSDYDAYVAGLHKTTITKSDVMRAWPSTRMFSSVSSLSDVYQTDYSMTTSSYTYSVSVTDDQILLIRYSSSILGEQNFGFYFYFVVPESGNYILSFSPGLILNPNYGYIAKNNPRGTAFYNAVSLYPTDYGMHITDSYYFVAGQVYAFDAYFSVDVQSALYQGSCFVDIVSDDYAFVGAEDYGSRPSGYDGTLAVPGDTTTYIDNGNVINGDVTTLYDYSNNATYNITNWTYDYGDRTYNLTLEDGSTAVVVYGDDGITVEKGAITTEYKYWLADDSGSSSSPGGDGSSSSPGGDSGGSWSGIADLLGKLLKGLSDFLGAILGAIFSALTSLLSVITGSLKSIVDGILAIFEQFPPLFLGFAQFLAAVFPYLPSEILSLLFFGIAAVVFVGLLRFFLNR